MQQRLRLRQQRGAIKARQAGYAEEARRNSEEPAKEGAGEAERAPRRARVLSRSPRLEAHVRENMNPGRDAYNLAQLGGKLPLADQILIWAAARASGEFRFGDLAEVIPAKNSRNQAFNKVWKRRYVERLPLSAEERKKEKALRWMGEAPKWFYRLTPKGLLRAKALSGNRESEG